MLAAKTKASGKDCRDECPAGRAACAARGHFVTYNCFAWAFRWAAINIVPTNGRPLALRAIHAAPKTARSAARPALGRFYVVWSTTIFQPFGVFSKINEKFPSALPPAFLMRSR